MIPTIGKTWITLGAALLTLSAARAGLPPSSAFSYQGQLRQGGVPFDGVIDLTFTLFDITGAQVGGSLISSEVDVLNGLFAVELDFGPDAFQGLALLLEVAVRAPSDPSNVAPFIPLSPRQKLTAVPFAVDALHARSVSDLALPINANTDQGGVAFSVTTSPASAEATAIRGESEVGGSTSAGVEGVASGPTGSVLGVRGSVLRSADGAGVLGEALAARGPTRGVWGRTLSAEGHAGYFEGRGYFSDRVGIGIEKPATELEVVGTIETRGLKLRTGATAGRVLQCVDAAGSAAWVDPPPTGDGHSLDAVDGAPVDALFVDDLGRVGIGTVAPSSALHVIGTGRVAGTFTATQIGIGQTSPDRPLHVTEGTDLDATLAGGLLKLGLGTGAHLLMDRNEIQAANGASAASLLLNARGGAVGIGTTVPEDALHVFKGNAGSFLSNINASVIIEDDSTTYLNFMTPSTAEHGILFGLGDATNASGGLIYNNSATPQGMQFRTGGNATRMVIDDAGQVGIGTTAPTAKLHVAGAATVTGALSVTAAAGNSSVQLPADSVSAAEIQNEAGLASDYRDSLITLTPDGTITVLSRSITVPTGGFVLAHVTASAQPGIIIGTASPTMFLHKQTAPAASTNGFSVQLGSIESGHISFHAVFAVSAGTNLFEVGALSFVNDCRMSTRRLTLMFIPTTYGTTDVED